MTAIPFTEQNVAKLLYICSHSFSGQLHSGIFYSWGALIDSINIGLNPNYNGAFNQDHGLFVGIIILFVSTTFMLPLRLLIETKLMSEFLIQLIGIILLTFGFCMGSIAVRYQMIWLIYIGCALPCGIGGLFVYQRVLFNHQFFFKTINRHNLGSGLYGFFIGVWTVVFFLISVPLVDCIGIGNVLLLYGLLAGMFTI